MAGRAVVESYDGKVISLLFAFTLNNPVVGVVPTPVSDLPTSMQVPDAVFSQAQLDLLDSGSGMFIRKRVRYDARVRLTRTKAQILTYITDKVLAPAAVKANTDFDGIDRTIVGFVFNVA